MTLGYAIPHPTKKLFEELGHGLGLNSMQGREAKHVKLAMYIKNTCNLKKKSRWPTVFRHEYVSLIWLKKMDPYSVSYKQGQGKRSESYIPKSVRENDGRFCQCGLLKHNNTGCNICTSSVTNHIRESDCWKDCPKSSRCRAFVMPTAKISVNIKFSSRWKIQYYLCYVIQLAFSD